MNFLPVLLVAATLGFDDPHVKANPVFAELMDKGVTSQLAPGFHYPLPKPVMADGLSPVEQKAAIESVIKNVQPLSEFLRNSPVAPHITLIPKLETIDGQPVRKLDVYFIAYGDLKKLGKGAEFGDLLTGAEKDAKGHVLTAKELKERGLPAQDEEDRHEAYGYGKSPVLESIELSAVAHTYWSTNDDSVVAAVLVDPRFIGDKTYPNYWKRLGTKDGKVADGEPQPYDGSGTYVKLTKLNLPEAPHALFVEIHNAFIEPHGWFDGQPKLSSKLGIAAQSQVRTFRRQLGQTLPKPPQQ